MAKKKRIIRLIFVSEIPNDLIPDSIATLPQCTQGRPVLAKELQEHDAVNFIILFQNTLYFQDRYPLILQMNKRVSDTDLKHLCFSTSGQYSDL